jgi:polyhydroxyalkanoate synthesis regulator phasin
MAEPENHTLHLLREIRAAIEALSTRMEQNHSEMTTRMDSLRQAAFGESVLGRYAAAEVEERLETLEKRVSALEESRS